MKKSWERFELTVVKVTWFLIFAVLLAYGARKDATASATQVSPAAPPAAASVVTSVP